jgi:hypothetical protein
MDKAIAQGLVQLMEEQGHEASLYEDYSGRGMYGGSTTGVVVDNVGTLLQAVISDAFEDCSILREVAEEHDMSPLDVDRISFDSLGLQQIVY